MGECMKLQVISNCDWCASWNQ